MTGNDNGSDSDAWERVLASLCHLQSVPPEAVVVGGMASALYAGHRVSFDHDHVLPDLRQRFDTVLDELESVSGWQTARVRRPVLILGSLDGVETGVRQLRRAQALETTTMRIGAVDATVPTLPEILRVKAFLCLDRNATRDYLDLAALTAHIGFQAATVALWPMDDLYPQKNGDSWAVRTQLVMQLAAPPPYDLDRVDLSEYKGVIPPFNRWEHIVAVCSQLACELLKSCVLALKDDPAAESLDARTRLDAWRAARDVGNAAPPPLPGLAS